MPCPSCLALPLALIGLTTSSQSLILGLLITILSLTIYLHYKIITKCEKCIENN